jgi:hypothetical protein
MMAIDFGGLNSTPSSASVFGSIAMNGDENVRCTKCGYGGCDVRVAGCSCTLHAVSWVKDFFCTLRHPFSRARCTKFRVHTCVTFYEFAEIIAAMNGRQRCHIVFMSIKLRSAQLRLDWRFEDDVDLHCRYDYSLVLLATWSACLFGDKNSC